MQLSLSAAALIHIYICIYMSLRGQRASGRLCQRSAQVSDCPKAEHLHDYYYVQQTTIAGSSSPAGRCKCGVARLQIQLAGHSTI